jgi:hypothetical protein
MSMTGKFGSLFGADGEPTNVLDADFGAIVLKPISAQGMANIQAFAADPTKTAALAAALQDLPPPPPMPPPPMKKVSLFHKLLVKLHLVKK